MHVRWTALALTWLLTATAAAQDAQPAAAPGADEPPPTAPDSNETTQETPVLEPGPQAQPPAAEAKPEEPGPEELSVERRRAALKWERARLQSLLAARRAGRPATSGAQVPPRPDHEAPRVHGDAGAAIAVGASMDHHWHTDRSYDLFASDDATARFGVWASYDVLSLGRDLILAAGLGWGVESRNTGAIWGSTISAELDSHAFEGALHLRYRLFPVLQPHLRVAGGAAMHDIVITPDAFDPRIERTRWSPLGSIGAGFLLRTPTRQFEDRHGRFASVSLGLLVEAGFEMQGPFSLDLDSNPGADRIALEEASLGEVKLSGPYLRTSAVVRF